MAHDKSKRDDIDKEPQRQGDILGLGGIAVPKSSDDVTTEFDEESTTQRRSREEDDDQRREETAYRRGSGATGIDMGAGGTGTDVE